jgi:hypothetical protein
LQPRITLVTALTETDPSTSEPSAAPAGRLDRLFAFLQRWPWLLPLLSFIVGWISFSLVQRGARMSRWIAAMVLLGWVVLLAEDFLGGLIVKLSRGRFSGRLLHFGTQQLQQEILFFALPFLITATHRDPGQMIFTGVVIFATLASTVDPLYMKRVAGAGMLSVAFHAFCSFLAGLVVLPVLLQLPFEKAVPLSLALTAALTLLSLPRLLTGVSIRHGVVRVCIVLVLLGITWFARANIPPAGLWVRQALITSSVSDDLVPGAPLKVIPSGQLADGVVAFVAVRAPLGLSQGVVFEWVHESQSLDRIAATVKGGDGAGYRTYSRKQNFPANSQGRWRVNLRTPDGQLISRMDFVVE